MAITKKMRKELNRNQFGEQAAVQMYSMLAKRMKDPRDAAAMERLSSDEARHAFAFRALTGNEVPPFPLLGVFFAMFVDWIFRDVFFLARWAGGKWEKRAVI